MTLPSPDPAFRWSHETWGAALRCDPIEPVAQHLFTTRQLRLRPFERQAETWAAAVAAAGGAMEDLQRLTQVHGCTVRVVRSAGAVKGAPAADAIVSNTAGQVLAVQVADCVPLLLADPRTGAVGAVHAGWRGSVARIAPAAVQTLAREFGVRPADLLVAVGPSIGPCCYQVGPEVTDAFQRAGAADAQLARWFTDADTGSLRLDLWAVNRDQLVEAGVAPDHIYLSRLCTQTHATVFDSYRVDGPNAGRMAALIRCAGPPREASCPSSTLRALRALRVPGDG